MGVFPRRKPVGDLVIGIVFRDFMCWAYGAPCDQSHRILCCCHIHTLQPVLLYSTHFSWIKSHPWSSVLDFHTLFFFHLTPPYFFQVQNFVLTPSIILPITFFHFPNFALIIINEDLVLRFYFWTSVSFYK